MCNFRLLQPPATKLLVPSQPRPPWNQVINNSYNSSGTIYLDQPGGKVTDLKHTLLSGFDTLIPKFWFLVLKTLIFEYFEKDGKELGLSPSDVKLAEAWYLVIDVGLFTVSALEGVRYFASLKYHETTCKIDSESIPLLSGRNV